MCSRIPDKEIGHRVNPTFPVVPRFANNHANAIIQVRETPRHAQAGLFCVTGRAQLTHYENTRALQPAIRDKLHQAIVGKIGEYDKNILNVGAEIKAMEKAFSKIIPEFAESVTELTELVENLRKDKKKPS